MQFYDHLLHLNGFRWILTDIKWYLKYRISKDSLQPDQEMEIENQNDIEVSSLRWPIIILYSMCLMMNSFNVSY